MEIPVGPLILVTAFVLGNINAGGSTLHTNNTLYCIPKYDKVNCICPISGGGPISVMERGRNLRKWLLGEIHREGEIVKEFHKTRVREFHKGRYVHKKGDIHKEGMIHKEGVINETGDIHKEGVIHKKREYQWEWDYHKEGEIRVKVASVPSKVNHSGSEKVNEEPKNKKEAGTAGDRVGRVVEVEGVLVNTIQKYFSLVPKLVR